ncbi:uncharacterized protein LOC133865895 isoform X1 [Alnus glutinosa]|uniref:uncharacterized protein LOC133865895 isoform X1 n=1 Tax=Alnus glutinosa TaxID=3517 RepID=UPI002D7841CD|nr:uncharacterized protein LOC133865895 isoform X1 [Alnus glutinosa]
MAKVCWPYFDPEYENFSTRINPPRVSVDNISCRDCTLIKVEFEICQPKHHKRIYKISAQVGSYDRWIMLKPSYVATTCLRLSSCKNCFRKFDFLITAENQYRQILTKVK